MAKSKKVVRRRKLVGSQSSKTSAQDKGKLRFILKDFFFFAVLFIVSIILYGVSTTDNYVFLFALLSIIFGFVALMFLIVLLVLLFVQFFKKK